MIVEPVRCPAAGTPEPLRIGLVVDSERQPWNVHALMDWARSRKDLEIVCLLVVRDPNERLDPLVGPYGRFRQMWSVAGIRGALFQLLGRFEAFLIGLLLKESVCSRKRNLTGFPQDATINLVTTYRVSPDYSRGDASGAHRAERVADEALERVAQLRLDLLVASVPGLLPNNLLRTARIGAVSLEHDGETVGATGTAAFEATRLRHDSTGFTIRKHASGVDGGEVLTQGGVRNRFSYLWNQRVLYRKSLHYLKKHLVDIATTRQWPEKSQRVPACEKRAGVPDAGEQLTYLLGFASSAVTRILRERVLGKVQRWSVFYARSDWTQLDMRRATRIENPANAFLADPFVVDHDGRTYCYVEELRFDLRRGSIAAYELSEGRAHRIGEVIREPFHMSFPFVFRHSSKLYMVPETSENRDVRVYECVRVPDKWVLRKVLMNDVSMADTMLFEHGGRWWMLTNPDLGDSGDYCAELHVFFADHPLSDRWIAHPNNPVSFDPRNARNAGVLFDGEIIYRVSQRQDFDTYGRDFSINRIDVLTPTDYVESRCFTDQPESINRPANVHHLHSNGRFSVFDRWEFERAATGAKVR